MLGYIISGWSEVKRVDLLVAVLLTLSGVVVCLWREISLAWALLAGFVCFFMVGLYRGFLVRALLRMTLQGGKTAFPVVRILLLIGLLTALWRASGTIAFFVQAGAGLITPKSFILMAFVLPATMSLAFGSSFGVAGTAGVILMTIARSADANLLITAGAILSGAYVGERLSPASSAAALVAAVAGTQQEVMQRCMWRTSVCPLLLTLLIYGVCSLVYPIASVDEHIFGALRAEFVMDWLAILPALLLIALPLFRVSGLVGISLSCALAAALALAVQGIAPAELAAVCVLGYAPKQPELAGILSGGGLVSMLSVVMIVVLSCSFSGLFSGTGMLVPWQEKTGRLVERVGLMPAHVFLGLCGAALFCNQAVTVVVAGDLMRERYRERGLSNLQFGVNLGDTMVTLPAMIPWSIACSVPLTTIGAPLPAVLFAVYLYMQPLSRCFGRAARQSGTDSGKSDRDVAGGG